MASRIIQGNVFDVLPALAPGSIDCAVTSPPYWMLRSYLAKGHALKHLELGQERTPAEYVASMVRVFALVREALADHGTVWINVGDTYAATGKSGGGERGKKWNQMGVQPEGPRGGKWFNAPGIDSGNLCLIPQRLMIALQDDGWCVRSIVVWHKPAPMPCSVAGWRWVRCRVKGKHLGLSDGKLGESGKPQSPRASHHGAEFLPRVEWIDCPGCKKCDPQGGFILRRGSWRPTSAYEPVIMLAKSRGYFADGDAVKTPAAAATVSRDQYTRVLDDADEQFAVRHDHETFCDGANLRDVWRADLEGLSKEELLGLLMDERDMPDVWTIASEPLREKHYAAYPTELVERCLRAGTSARGYCRSCGAPWARVVETKAMPHPHPRGEGRDAVDRNGGNQASGSAGLAPEVRTIDWRPSCSCKDNAPRPGLVLDPFAGSGRTGIAAMRLGLDFTGVDLNPEYVAMGQRILREEAPLFA